MPLRLKESLPVIEKLKKENIFAMTEERASHQDIRELKIAILNLMPDKENTEQQLLRLLSNSPLQIDVTFVRLVSHKYKNTPLSYLLKNYCPFYEIENKYFDGLIITGAPVEKLEYEDVDYWGELTSIMEWARLHVTSTLYLCWAAQAGLYYHYGVNKFDYDKKLSGIYEHTVTDPTDELVRGFDKNFYAPHSRYTGISRDDIEKNPELTILAGSEITGPYIISDGGSNIFVNGHPEYDLYRLAEEYIRDTDAGLDPDIPVNYFPDDDPDNEPVSRWISASSLLFSNWLNYFVYQITPYKF
ncbi:MULTISPECIES: homoserine O-succinyltransferase [Ruminococcus]|uniref:Homoserine O-acetyltransferase n=1 Tax=Ruminococcus albus (strain ATCC 27210 / DSM 20455 / JCM 14654 / NCDO 2250 / 7) TaxID=697329 RepID=E6UE48_RUMA7|nr:MULTISPECIES: homoserine O-succinyltransferase [Ruminococcus]ADU22913.1 homoserine O-succinyltransferase [Ruminococcus albus 7 = DSM 20455]MCR5019885.1 homoserine O-succinyltransferase [Ruminococcus sp.]